MYTAFSFLIGEFHLYDEERIFVVSNDFRKYLTRGVCIHLRYTNETIVNKKMCPLLFDLFKTATISKHILKNAVGTFTFRDVNINLDTTISLPLDIYPSVDNIIVHLINCKLKNHCRETDKKWYEQYALPYPDGKIDLSKETFYFMELPELIERTDKLIADLNQAGVPT